MGTVGGLEGYYWGSRGVLLGSRGVLLRVSTGTVGGLEGYCWGLEGYCWESRGVLLGVSRVTVLFHASFSLQKVPSLWKTSIVVPVSKKSCPGSPNDFRPVALTSHVMKSFEKIIKTTMIMTVQIIF